MNLQQLRYLVAVIDYGTMTDAARRLHVSQPALSRAIRALEVELNVTLLDRVGRNVELAPGAEDIVATIRRICCGVDELEQQVIPAAQRLTICTSATTEALLFARVIPEFSKQMPAATIRIVHATGEGIEASVMAGQADFGFTDHGPSGSLESLRLADQEIVLASPSALSLPDPLPRQALGEVPLVYPLARSTRRAAFVRLFDHLGVAPPIAVETDERAAWANAVSAGIASALTLSSAAAQFERVGARIRSFDPPLHSPMYLVGHVGHLRQPADLFRRLAIELLGLSEASVNVN